MRSGVGGPARPVLQPIRPCSFGGSCVTGRRRSRWLAQRSRVSGRRNVPPTVLPLCRRSPRRGRRTSPRTGPPPTSRRRCPAHATGQDNSTQSPPAPDLTRSAPGHRPTPPTAPTPARSARFTVIPPAPPPAQPNASASMSSAQPDGRSIPVASSARSSTGSSTRTGGTRTPTGTGHDHRGRREAGRWARRSCRWPAASRPPHAGPTPDAPPCRPPGSGRPRDVGASSRLRLGPPRPSARPPSAPPCPVRGEGGQRGERGTAARPRPTWSKSIPRTPSRTAA